MTEPSWYREQYNALRDAQLRETALSDALHRENIGRRVAEVKHNAQQAMDVKELWNKERIARDIAENERNYQWSQEQIARNRAQIQARYATIEVPNGNGGFTSVPSEFSRSFNNNGGSITPSSGISSTLSSGTINSVSPQKYAVPLSQTAPVYEAEFRSASPVNDIRQANSVPPSPPSIGTRIGGQLLTTGASVASGFAGDYVGDRASEAVFGSSNGIGSNIGSAIGGTIGAIAGAAYGGFWGMAAGSFVGSAAGSFIGSFIDNLLGWNKPKLSDRAADLGRNKNRNQPIAAPYVGGGLGVNYNVTVTGFVDATFRSDHFSALRPGVSGVGPITSIRVDYNPPSATDSRHTWDLVVQFSNYTYRGGIFGLNGSQDINQFSWGVEDIDIFRTDGQPDASLPPTYANGIAPQNTPFAPNNPIPNNPIYNGEGIDVLEGNEKYIQGTGIREKAKPVNTGFNKPNAGFNGNIPPAPTSIFPNPAISNLSPSLPIASKPTTTTPYGTPQQNPQLANIEDKFRAGLIPSFTAKPYVSGISKPSESSDPIDVATGLTRSQFDKAYKDYQDKVRFEAKAPQRAAAAEEAQAVQKQLASLSNTPSDTLQGKSPRQYQADAYFESIKNDPIRLEAAKQVIGTQPSVTPSRTVNNNVLPKSDSQQLLDNLGVASLGLIGLGLTTGAVLTGVDALKNTVNNINQNTSPTAQKANLEEAMCNATQPGQCARTNIENAVVNGTNPIKEIANDNKGLLGQVLAAIAALSNLLATIWQFLQDKIGIVLKLLNNQVVDRAVNMMNLAINITNLLMLTESAGKALGGIVDAVFAITPFQFENDKGQKTTASSVFGQNATAMVVNIIGEDNYASLKENLAVGNRIIKSQVNGLNQVTKLLSQQSKQQQKTGIEVANIGNALIDNGVINQNSYPKMPNSPEANAAMTVEDSNIIQGKLGIVKQGIAGLKKITQEINSKVRLVKGIQKTFKTVTDLADGESKARKAIRNTAKQEAVRKSKFKNIHIRQIKKK